MVKRMGLIVALLLIASLVAACGGGGGNDQSDSGGSSSADAVRIEVSGVDFAFNPNRIEVNRGTPVEIVFSNDGRVAHDLVISELNAETPVIAPGRTSTIQFTPARAGEYKMVCTEPGHEASGMVGTLVVK